MDRSGPDAGDNGDWGGDPHSGPGVDDDQDPTPGVDDGQDSDLAVDPPVGRQVAVLVAAGGVLILAAVLVVAGAVTLDLDDDSDDDGLPEDREQALGTDPRDPDTDGDGLRDGWEVANETPAGTPLPNSDPMHRDLYVQVNYGERVPPLTDRERADLRRAWAEMAVDNPDGRQGITLHITDADPRGGKLDRRVIVRGNVSQSALVERFYTRELLGDRRCVYHLVVFGVVENGSAVGYGETPGHLTVVEGTALLDRGSNTSARVRYAVHELLHNVVGRLDGGDSHTDRGWLAHDSGDLDDSVSLALRTRRALDGGFATEPRAEGC